MGYPHFFHSSGQCIILADGYEYGFIADTMGWESRNVEEPATQTVVRGPRDGFTENIRTNTSLIRRRIKDPNLWLENGVIGTVSKTNVGIMYINGIVNEKILAEVRIRLDRSMLTAS